MASSFFSLSIFTLSLALASVIAFVPSTSPLASAAGSSACSPVTANRRYVAGSRVVLIGMILAICWLLFSSGLFVHARAVDETLGPVGSLSPKNFTHAHGPDYNHD